MPISRDELNRLRGLGVSDGYNLIQGDNTNPQATDTFEPTPQNPLDILRNAAGISANPVIPVTQPNILDQVRKEADVKLPLTPLPQVAPKSPVIGEAIQKIAKKETKPKDAERSLDSAEVTEQLDKDGAKLPYDSTDELKAAQSTANTNAKHNSILEAALGIGAALGRTPADYTGLDDLKAQGQRPLGQYKEHQAQVLADQKTQQGIIDQQRAAEENNPEHPISVTVREVLASMGFPVSENTTAKQLKDQGVDIGKLLGIKETAAGRKATAELSNSLRKDALDQKELLQDQRIHNQVAREIDRNPNVKSRVTQIQNLDNALAMLQTFPEGATPQMISDAQQLIVRNMGITGSSGVGERAERYIHTAGMKGAGLMQFITGDPVYLAKNSNLMNYIKRQADTERGNANDQLLKTINMVSSGHGSLYGRRPELLNDLKDKISSYKEGMQAGATADGNPASMSSFSLPKAPPSAPKGSVNVIDPSGKSGFIPESQLEEALKQGYKRG